MSFNKKMYIAGELVEGQGTVQVINQATDKPVATLPAAGMDDYLVTMRITRTLDAA